VLRENLGALSKEIKKRTGWISGSDPEDDVKDALKRLKEMLGKSQSMAKR
jgi:hypothetical protein